MDGKTFSKRLVCLTLLVIFAAATIFGGSNMRIKIPNYTPDRFLYSLVTQRKYEDDVVKLAVDRKIILCLIVIFSFPSRMLGALEMSALELLKFFDGSRRR